MCPRILGNFKTKSVSIILRIVNSSQITVYLEPMLFTKVKVPSLNVEPGQPARMHLWSNFIRFCKYRFLCHGSGDITCVSAEQGKSYKLHALLIETAFPDTYAALSEPVLFARVKYYISFASFCKKYLVHVHMLI